MHIMKQSKIKSGILFEGKSLIDGSPLVVIGIAQSSNSKTGNMVQTYIIRADIDPITANRTGADYAICGNCKHRGKANPDKISGLADNRSCYVNLGQGVNQVYKAYKAGKYPILTPEQAQSMGAGRMVRLGTYGDPAAVPFSVFNALLSGAVGHTGYSHQLGLVPVNRRLMISVDRRLMISVDTAQEASKAQSQGYRTFRVIPIGSNDRASNEIVCPATTHGVQCKDCGLCDGTKKGKNVVIEAHGVGAKYA